MITTIIKFSFIYFFSLNICFKLTTKSITKSHTILFISASILLSIVSHFLDIYFMNFKYIIPLLILWIIMSIYTETPQIIFIAIILSFGISYSFYAILSFIIIGIVYTFFNHFVYLPYPLLALLPVYQNFLLYYYYLKSNALKEECVFFVLHRQLILQLLFALFSYPF